MEYSMNRIIKAMEKEQCDVKDALTRCMNMEELYVELLGLFAEDTQIDKLVDAFRKHNVEDVFFHSHTLKGVYTNLGMSQLYELDVPIVESTRDKQPEGLDGLDSQVSKLYEEHKRIADVIREYI